jgi:putative oxidoreductase
MAYGLLLLRLFVGASFFGHGTQKLFGWFGGYGPQGTGGFFASQGYRHGVRMAVLAGIAEAGGGLLLAFGLLTPLACTAIAIVMLNAIFAVTLKRAFLLGSELELMYLVTAIALAAIGPGRFSLDRAIGWDDRISGLWWGVGALALAAVVSLVTLTFFHSKPAPQAAPSA